MVDSMYFLFHFLLRIQFRSKIIIIEFLATLWNFDYESWWYLGGETLPLLHWQLSIEEEVASGYN